MNPGLDLPYLIPIPVSFEGFTWFQKQLAWCAPVVKQENLISNASVEEG